MPTSPGVGSVRPVPAPVPPAAVVGNHDVDVQRSQPCSEVPSGSAQVVSSPPVRGRSSVRGTFHQGDGRFRYGGVQCMAISLVAVAKHTTDSVFSWQSDTLDRVLTWGDELYTELREGRRISGGASMLCVPDLPKERVVDGQTFEFAYGEDFVTGDIDVVAGELIDVGVYTSLRNGLSEMFSKYETCLLTLRDSTCALICQNGQYAVVDSHARSADGMVDQAGKSVVVYFNTREHLFNHLVKFAGAFYAPKVFEIAGVRVTVKKCDSSDDNTVNDDVVFVSDVGGPTLEFHPLRREVTDSLCKRLNIESEFEVFASGAVGGLGAPCKTEKIVRDGNCFFRALSQAISGTQKHHRKIRLAVVKEMERDPLAYAGILRREFSSVSDYLTVSRMRFVGNWATEVEIQVAAECLGVDIFTYCDGGWLGYRCRNGQLCQGVYLENRGQHYETVICVKRRGTDRCYGYCQVETISDFVGYSLRSKTEETFTSQPAKQVRKKFQRVSKSVGSVERRERQKELSRESYEYSSLYRERHKATSTLNYRLNVLHREKLKEMSRRKYRSDVRYREAARQKSVRKYRSDVRHREAARQKSVRKYRLNVTHREAVRQMSRKKYKSDLVHQVKVREMSKNRYADVEYRGRALADLRVKRQELKEKGQEFDFVMQQFLDKVRDGPEFVCCVCHRLLFRYQVLVCKRTDYNKNDNVAAVARKCITDDYLHKCQNSCVSPCQWVDSPRGKLWVCYSCHSKMKRGQEPPEWAGNNLSVCPIPPELACLNSLERHLIALHIPFMKMLALPKGGQNGVHGPVTCVPANIVQTNDLLPRSNMEGSLLRVKLKRKLTYKGHYEYEFVDTMRVRRALQCLKALNVHYRDVAFNEAWLNEFTRDDDDNTEVVVDDDKDVEDELLHDRQQHCMFQDSCFMPVDMGQEVLDQYFEDVLNVAPGEGNTPVKLLSDKANEAKCFPVLFPQGVSTYHDSRSLRLTLCRYFNNRILNADGRFARDIEYIFFAQYMSEIEHVVSNVSVALRKGRTGGESVKVNNLLKTNEGLKEILGCDDGYRFLKPIRGTPAFWQGAQSELLACVRQLGVPTWFCSFSSADLRWENLTESTLRQAGRTERADQLDWADRCDLLRKSPVTAARMFDFRWHSFLKDVLLSPSSPIGKIKDHFYRVEFQQRGSPHVHCLFWVEGAPVIDRESDEEVIDFIDRYVTCALPEEDDPLREVATSVQQHSRRHSKSCKKKNTTCRFNFPRPVSARTFISRKEVDKDCTCELSIIGRDPKCEKHGKNWKMGKEMANTILSKVKEALQDEKNQFANIEELFNFVGINQDIFEEAYRCRCRKTEVVLKRDVNEAWINQYNRSLLECWNANIDIQFVVDAYACVVYIISYISKSEREMGLLLSNAQKEASKEANMSAREALNSLGTVYLHNRDVCAQEAVYRLTNMHLKECSRKVVFVPTGDNIVKMSLPLKVLRQRAASEDVTSENIWMRSLVDRYRNRPRDAVFDDMCCARFASEYRIVGDGEKCRNAIQLMGGCGSVVKRTRTQPAVVRYARFSETKYPEKFFLSVLQLFCPYREDGDLKPEDCETFEEFYKTGCVRFRDGSIHSVEEVVDSNRLDFEVEAEDLEKIRNEIDDQGALEDAWCELCPQQEAERLECLAEMEGQAVVVEGQEEIPDLGLGGGQVPHVEKRQTGLSRAEGLALIRSLNETQLGVFLEVRQWCLDRANGREPAPLHVFITGGAGTGKSHLIRAIQFEATRLLSPTCRHPDNICVMLTAPTGIAAFNLKATTIHTSLSIGKDVRLPYTPLGEEKLNSLRVKYCDLQILIIDEISMVDHNLLSYIHSRLRQIKQTGDYSPFGRVSVIAVGDFFQLPPVKGKPLYAEGVYNTFWFSLFKIVELTEVVRQKDREFADLLNRVRCRSKDTKMLDRDIQILKGCETGESSLALHIFATNKEVSEHNAERFYELCEDFVRAEAQDYINDSRTGKLRLMKGHHSCASNTTLVETLLLGEGARVMLCKNVDVEDGLVNGVCGVVTYVDVPSKGTFPRKVFVKFDDDSVGQQRRKQCPCLDSRLQGSTAIEPEEERAAKKGGMRRQFPLRLAWACTVHKVQGITVDSAVVSLAKVFAPGQAYVALSRVRTLSGLIIRDFDEKKIYCKDNVKDALRKMAPFEARNRLRTLDPQSFSVVSMNVQSLTRHVADLALCAQQWQPSCIAVTETWLSAASSLDAIKIDGFSFHNCPRHLSYRSSHPALMALQDKEHGGVGLYRGDGVVCDILDVPPVNLECLVSRFDTQEMVLAVVYRPPCYPLCLFKENLGQLVDWLEPQTKSVVVMGDFNDDVLKSSSLLQYMTGKGFVQVVKEPTTERGTLIDHVYVKTDRYRIEVSVIPTYFSDHEAVVCCFCE